MDCDLNDYAASLEYLFARTTGSFKFGLERTHALLDAFGNPHETYPVFHIAGTNGKGSSVATAYAILHAKGLRVGRYTSPHLVDFPERILVDNATIPAEKIVDFVRVQTPLVEKLGATFFEATTALAFQHFADERVDVALIEAGLGGRLDSTNVVTPVAAGVTSIGYDHMEYLGPTLEAIASEKAGIFKSGAPAVIGEPDTHVRTWLADAARHRGATPVHVIAEEMTVGDIQLTSRGTQFSLRAPGGQATVETPLVGRHQAQNFAFTFGLLNAAGQRFAATLPEAAEAVKAVRLPGRFQRVGHWIFDVAHNADGATTLAGSLAAMNVERPLVALMCVLVDKEWRSMMDALAPVVDRFVLTNAPTAPASRAWDLAAAEAYATQRGYSARSVEDFDVALRDVEMQRGTVVVTGSFHTVGDAMSRLQVSPLTG